MKEHYLSGLSLIVVCAVTAQWIAWKFRLPSILVFLIFGFILGPVTNLVETNEILGHLVPPFVALAIAVLLFEGGLTLKFSDVKDTGLIVVKLISVGAFITFLLTAIFAHLILGLDYSISLLLSGVIVVTGPTVIIPMLKQVRMSKQLASVLKWEGIMIDPIGVTLAVLVFEAIVATGIEEATVTVFAGVVKTFFIGASFGYLSARFFMGLVKHRMIPDFLQNPFALMLVVGSFALSEVFQQESGLLTATIMGLVLANQNQVSVKHVLEFKETLTTLLVPILFIVLASRVDLNLIPYDKAESYYFLAALIFGIRPFAVLVSTSNAGLSWKERVLLCFVAPRGVVAASMSSIFALELARIEFELDFSSLVPITFFVIIGTVLFYGLSVPVLVRVLGLREEKEKGLLIVGAHSWAREIAKKLNENGCDVLLIDTNSYNVDTAKREGIPAHRGSIYLDNPISSVVLEGMGQLVALTSNDEVNTLAVLHYAELFGSDKVHQLSSSDGGQSQAKELNPLIRERNLFGQDITYRVLGEAFVRGAEVIITHVSEDTELLSLELSKKELFIPMFIIKKDKDVKVINKGDQITLLSDEVLVSVVL